MYTRNKDLHIVSRRESSGGYFYIQSTLIALQDMTGRRQAISNTGIAINIPVSAERDGIRIEQLPGVAGSS
ncbi:hypothetical protein E2C01_088687 [Portunus trituberculatus]|uniref:Uncharacterized protein n=1 Tax=Portunus trituberculatus TaxID=210409 RepID=A0A5B7JMJ9_PORTR|nr:hypothetical protein [Portunus trituberculatus]